MDTPRKLAAILAADIVGYSRLMGLDEVGTAKLLREHRAAIDPILAGHGGRIFKTTGDGVLVEFPSIVAAVESALAVQRLMAERNADVPEDRRMLFRIGINLGDVLIEGDDILGDGVNVAARLEAIAQPGGVCVSEDAYRQTRGKVDAQLVDIGEQNLKNIARPVRAYRVVFDGALTAAASTLPLPSKPSIAVLAFQNMSGDPEQEYFADGIAEDIITALSRTRRLFVIARNSSFTYKGRAVDVKQIGRELGVRYVLEGSVRKAASRVRVTGQLIDAATAAHLWAERFDSALEDIFALQDQVTARVVTAIVPKVERAEIERSKRKPTERLDAYDYFLRGMASFYKGTRSAMSDALQLFEKAVALDPEFGSAYGMAAWCHVQRQSYGWMTDRAQESAAIEGLARRAIRVGEDDPTALYTGGYALARVQGQLEAGAAVIDRALALDPNLAAAWHLNGWVKIYLGDSETALQQFGHAMRLSPLDPFLFGMQHGMAAAHFLAGRYEEAASWAQKVVRDHPNYVPALRMAAACNVFADNLADAQEAMARMRKIDPCFRAADLKDVVPFRRPQDIARYAEGLRRAGLPD
jgi:TolB-like protein